jgi:hypothetical protein
LKGAGSNPAPATTFSDNQINQIARLPGGLFAVCGALERFRFPPTIRAAPGSVRLLFGFPIDDRGLGATGADCDTRTDVTIANGFREKPIG